MSQKEPSLLKTIITGVSRVVKESIFAGANNFKVYTVLDNEFSTDFGITEQEMNNIIQDFQIEDKKDEIKRWYDGDKIGIEKPTYTMEYDTQLSNGKCFVKNTLGKV